jgi:WD40 repeat protein
MLGVVAGARLLPRQALAGRTDEDKPPAGGVEQSKPTEAMAVRTDRYGDPLLDGGVARLGTMRWRHAGEARALVFSPDGTLLASVCAREVILWESATGQVRRRLPASGPLDFTPDGRVLAVGGAREGVSLWDVASGKCLRTPTLPPSEVSGSCRAVRFTADGKTVAVGLGDQAYLVDMVTAKVVSRLDAHRSTIDDIAFAPDTKTVALATADPSVQLWDLATRKLIRRLGPDKERLFLRVAISPDGKMLAAGSRDGTPLWHPATGEDLGRLEVKMGGVVGLAFTPDGKTLLSAGEDGKVYIWDVPGLKLRRTLDGHGWIGRSMALSADGKRVALGTAYNAIRLWDVETGKELFTEFEGHDAPVNCVAFTPDGKTLVSGGFNLQTRVWDAATWTQTRLLKGSARTISFTPDGKRMATIAYNKTVRVWDFATGTDALQLELPDTAVIQSALFAADGKTLISMDAMRNPGRSHDTTRLVVWDASADRRLREMTFAEGTPWSLPLTPDGKSALVGEAMGPIHLYDLETGKEILTLAGHQHVVGALAVPRDGKVLLSGSDDCTGRLWDVLSGKEVFTLAGHKRTVGAVAFSPDGRLAASGGCSTTNPSDLREPRRIRLWDLFTGKEVAHFEGHTADVTSLAFSPDGSRLVSGLRDGTVLVWDVTALPRLPALAVRVDELDGLCKDLAASNVLKVHQAVWKLTATPDKAVPFLKEHVPPAAEVDADKVRRWIADLDSEEFAVRAAAVKELERLGDRAAPALREALAGKPSAEVRKQAEELLAGLRLVRSPEVLQRLRAVEVLERIGSPEAHRLLEALARGAPAARETREAKASLDRLARRPPPE